MDPKKELFIDTLIKTFGNITQTAQMVGVVRQTYYDWLKHDPEFKAAIDNITNADYLEAKKDFIEASLMKLIVKGNPAAVIFAAKTICKDRGYIERQEIDVSKIGITWVEERYTDNNEIDPKANGGN